MGGLRRRGGPGGMLGGPGPVAAWSNGDAGLGCAETHTKDACSTFIVIIFIYNISVNIYYPPPCLEARSGVSSGPSILFLIIILLLKGPPSRSSGHGRAGSRDFSRDPKNSVSPETSSKNLPRKGVPEFGFRAQQQRFA